MSKTIPLPEPDYQVVISGQAIKIHSIEAIHAHAAAVSAAKDAEIAGLRADAIDQQNNVVMPLRERVRVLEDALQRYVNHDLLTGTRGKMNEIARAALEQKP